MWFSGGNSVVLSAMSSETDHMISLNVIRWAFSLILLPKSVL